MNQSVTPTESLINENDRYSQRTLHQMVKYTRYNRPLSFQTERASSNGRSRIIIHANIRPPSSNRHLTENKTTTPNVDLHSISTIPTARYHQDKANSAKQTQSATRSLNINKASRRHRSLSQSSRHSWNDNNGSRYPQEQNDYLAKTEGSTNYNSDHNYRRILKGDKISSSSKISVITNDLDVFGNSNKTTETNNSRSNTKDILQDSTKKKRKKKYPAACPCSCSCPCLLAFLLTALLLSIVIAAALIVTSIKPKTTTTTQSTASTPTSAIAITVTTIFSTTTVSTTMTITETSTTTETTTSSILTFAPMVTTTSSPIATTSVTTTVSTSSTSTNQTTTTSTQCTTPTSTALHYQPGSSTYVLGTYSYVALSTGTAVLEFGFKGKDGNDLWYLDDVSIVDTNASNSEMLINGGFENGTLVGWQALCSSNCGSSSGILSTSSCNTGLFCYNDGCKGDFDFLRQMFTTAIGHIYTLNFWLKSDIKLQDEAIVRIF